jgi:hypothetical protein
MGKMFGEPVIFLVAGGTGLVQAIMQFLIAFNVPITGAQQAAITTLAGIIFALLTRTQVTPMATLPAGVAGKIADAAAADKAGKDKP